MGVVYRARQPGLDRLVALKVIRTPDLAKPEQVERFVAEARSLARLQHPNIVHVYEVGTHDGQPFFAMEYVAGGSLDLHTRRQPQPAADAVRLVEVLARAVQHAHERGIVHRDLKPANVLLAPSAPGDAGHTTYGLPKLTDFGLARGGDRLQTADGVVLGTPSYMAPEQAAGDSARVGPATDVWALGAILYELLTGRPPFQGDSLLATLEQVRHGKLIPPRRLRPDLSAALEAVVLRCLSRRPEERYPSAAALADDLGQLGQVGPTIDYRPADLPAPRGWRRWAGRVAVGLLAVAVLVGVGLLLWPRGDTAAPEGQRGGPPVALAPLKGVLDVRIWENGNPLRRGLRLHQEGALPLRPGDLMRVEVEMIRPAYLYVVWLGADGKATPLYPWRHYRWDELPATPKQQRLYLPEDPEKDAAPLANGPSGVETLVLLARDEPLPAGADVAGLFTGLPHVGQNSLVRAAWFENGRLAQGADDRGPPLLGAGQAVDDPLLRLQQVLGRQVPRHFGYSRAVSFAFRGH
jgi:tRNA A-37 threonylcarbamoyl transferase component Bud32